MATAWRTVSSTGGPATGVNAKNRAENVPNGTPVGCSPSSLIDARTNFSYLYH